MTDDRIYRTQVAQVIEAGRVHGLTPTEGTALHEVLGHAGALDCIGRFGSWVSPAAATVYERRASAMQADATGLTQAGGTNAVTTAAAREDGAPPFDPEAIYARRAVQTSGG
jgi:hypothetical protein